MRYLARVAIIVRTKDRPLFLERAIRSALDQTFTDWFLIVANDGGDKEPVDQIVNQFEDQLAGRVAVIHHDAPHPYSNGHLVNRALAYGDSEYVVVHDDDDSWAPQFLLMGITELERERRQFPSVQGVITHSLAAWEHIENGTIILEEIEPFNDWIPQGLLGLFRVAQENIFPPASFLYRREALSTTGPYREDLLGIGDWEFNLRFISHFDVFVVPYALTFHHLRRAATGSSGNVVTGDERNHALYEQYLRNDLLRQEMNGDSRGLGMLVNLAHQFAFEDDLVGQTNTRIAEALAAMSRQGTQIGEILARLDRIVEHLTSINLHGAQVGEILAQLDQLNQILEHLTSGANSHDDQINQITARTREIQDQVSHIAASLVGLQASVMQARMLAGGVDKRGAPGCSPAWIVRSVFRFLASSKKSSLLRKFMVHLRHEGAARAFQVVVRFGYHGGEDD